MHKPTSNQHPIQSLLWEDLLCLAFSTGLLCLGMYSGIGYTYDSHWYLEGANFLNNHAWWALLEHRTFLAKPPLYPVLLFIIQNQGPWLGVVHVFFWLITLGLSLQLCNHCFPQKPPRLAAKCLLVFATPLYLVFMFWWSEPLFLCWGSLYYGLHFLYFRRPSPGLLAGIILCGLGMLFTRHIGIFFTGVSGLYLLFWSYQQTSLSKRGPWLNASLGPFLFLAWHYAVIQKIQSLKILNYTLELDLVYNLHVMGQGFTQWIMPLPRTSLHLLSIPVFLGLLLFLVYETFAHHHAKRWILSLLALSSLSYIGLMLLKGDLLPDDIERYLSLVYIQGAVLCMHRLSRQKLSFMYSWLFALWLLYPALRTLKNLSFWGGWTF